MLFKHLQNNNDIINEAYYGKTEELKQCEELLKNLAKKIREDDLLILNETKEAKQISRLLSSMFKIKSLELVFTMEHQYGAHTYGFSGGFLKTDENGFSDLSNVGLVIIMPLMYMVDMNFTEGEMVAILLHELGHSLNASILNLLAKIPIITLKKLSSQDKQLLIQYIPYIASQTIPSLSVFYSKWIGGVQKNISDQFQSNKFIKEIMKYFRGSLEILNTINTLRKISSILSHKWVANLLVTAIQPQTFLGYNSEVYSDSVATAYGYGPDLSTALTKLASAPSTSMVNDIFNRTQTNVIGGIFVSGLSNFMYLYKEIIMMYFKPHPMTANRVLKQIKKCRRELANPNITHDMRKSLNSDLKLMEDFVENELLNYKKNLTRGTFPQYVVNFVVIKIFKEFVDIREVLQLVYRNEA